MDLQFEAKGKRFIAADTGWQKNGYRVYEILDETDYCVDTVMVHPLDNIVDAVDEWARDYQSNQWIQLTWPMVGHSRSWRLEL